jgi:ElaB/YqjD/DUF883 family membrane-anchored ribosome-binding protein
MLKTSKTKHHHHDLSDDLARIKAIMSSTADDVKDSAADILSDSVYLAKEKSNLLNQTITGYVRKKPLKSLGISFLSGLCISYLIKRR